MHEGDSPPYGSTLQVQRCCPRVYIHQNVLVVKLWVRYAPSTARPLGTRSPSICCAGEFVKLSNIFLFEEAVTPDNGNSVEALMASIRAEASSQSV